MKTTLFLILSVFITLIHLTGYGGTTPTASFTIAPSNVVPPGTNVCFTNTSTTPIGTSMTNWNWTFAGQAANYNATTAATANPPCILMNTPGTYNICLSVTNDNPKTANVCQTVTVSPPYNIGTENGHTLNNICGFFLTDDGGSGNYANNQNDVVTLCSGTTDNIQLNFSQIGLAAGDYIEVYAGTGMGGALISTITSANTGQTPSVVSSTTCVTIHFVTNASGVSTGFSLQAVCNPGNQYNIGAFNGQSVSGCSGTFTDTGGTGANYGNNENKTITFCAGSSAQVVQMLFNNLNLAAGDIIYFYDGPTTSGSLIYTAQSTDNGTNSFLFPGLTVTGISQCMTAQFISNSSGVQAGWNAALSCKTPPTPCGTNPIAADNFDAATLICDFTQYCGTTSSFYGVDMPNIGQTSVFDGSLENNSWLSFVADGPTAAFTVSTGSGCSGIQIGVYAVSATESFTWLSPESINGGFDYTNIDDGFTGTGILHAQGMVAGNTYYIMIDGLGGAVCNYSLTAGIGVQLPNPIASPDIVMCAGDVQSVSVVDGNGSTNVDWTWTWNNGGSPGGPAVSNTINLSSFPPGNYTFDVDALAFAECSTDDISDQVMVTITNCTLPVELASFDVDCHQANNLITWTTNSESNSDHFILEKAGKDLMYSVVKIIPAAGTSNSPLNYQVLDPQRNSDLSYYRLSLVDKDNSEVYTQIAMSKTCQNLDEQTTIWFDQISKEIVISYNGTNDENAYLILTDLIGNQYINTAISINAKNNQLRIDASTLKMNTIYLVQLQSNGEKITERLFLH